MAGKSKDTENINTGGGAYIGGSVDTGGGKFTGRDDNSTTVVQQGASIDEFRKLVAELGQALRQANLPADAAEVIEGDFKVVEQQAAAATPSSVKVKSKLSSIVAALKDTAGAAGNLDKILATGEKLMDMAAKLFS